MYRYSIRILKVGEFTNLMTVQHGKAVKVRFRPTRGPQEFDHDEEEHRTLSAAVADGRVELISVRPVGQTAAAQRTQPVSPSVEAEPEPTPVKAEEYEKGDDVSEEVQPPATEEKPANPKPKRRRKKKGTSGNE